MGQRDRREGGRSTGQHADHYRHEKKDGTKPSKTPALLKS